MNPTTPTIGDGTRILHFLVDTLLITLIAYLVYGWWNFYVMYWNFTPIRFGPFFFGSMWVYVFLFEFIFLRTPAKWLTGTKVVSEKGGRPNIFQFFIRATLRTTIVSMFGLAWNGQPLHDTFSKTKLVYTANPAV
ncbi:MAG: RDD family protein [Bacteroidetes bacterium]|nr:RDD family protein [Bacteroidota bacterium]